MKLFTVLAVALAVCAAVEATTVVRFAILEGDGDPPADDVARGLRDRLEDGLFGDDVGHDVLNFSVLSEIGTSSSAASRFNPTATLALVAGALAVVASGFSSSSSSSSSRSRTMAAACVLLVAVALSPSALRGVTAQSEDYDHCMILDEATNYRLSWRIDGTDAHFKVEGDGEWLGFGLSADGSMPSGGAGSDITVSWVDDSGCTGGCAKDYWATQYSMPALDTIQNTAVVGGFKVDGRTTVEFTRPLAAGEADADRAITPGTDQHVIWSVNPNAVPTDGGALFGKHTTEGAVIVDFDQASVCAGDDEYKVIFEVHLDVEYIDFSETTFRRDVADALSIPVERVEILGLTDLVPPVCPECEVLLDFTMPNYLVPTAETTYACMGFEIPVDKVYMIAGFETSPDNANVIHHVVTYVSDVEGPASPVDACTMPSNAEPIHAWAPTGQAGATVLKFPTDAGYEVGAGTGNQYVWIQYHYDNPTGLTDEYDSTNLRIFMTENLRPRQVAFSFVGIPTSPVISIPQNTSSWYQTGGCSSADTSSATYDLDVIMWLAHLHGYGRKMTLSFVRGGTEVASFSNEAFDWNAQKFVDIDPPFVFQPGDEVVVKCDWDTTGATGLVTGGEDTDEEMCVAVLISIGPLNVDVVGGGCFRATIGDGVGGCACDWPCDGGCP